MLVVYAYQDTSPETVTDEGDRVEIVEWRQFVDGDHDADYVEYDAERADDHQKHADRDRLTSQVSADHWRSFRRLTDQYNGRRLLRLRLWILSRWHRRHHSADGRACPGPWPSCSSTERFCIQNRLLRLWLQL